MCLQSEYKLTERENTEKGEKTMTERIANINRKLEASGSIFRTEDGLTVSGYIGNLTFLKKTYGSIEELEAAAEWAANHPRA